MRCKIAMLSCTFVIFWSPCICIIILSSQIFYSLKLRFSAVKANNDWPSLTTCNQFHETADPYDCSPWSVSLLKSTNMQKNECEQMNILPSYSFPPKFGQYPHYKFLYYDVYAKLHLFIRMNPWKKLYSKHKRLGHAKTYVSY